MIHLRRSKPIPVQWEGDPCIFCKTNISSTKSYSKRTQSLISSQRLGSINITEVGYMTRNENAGISAHYNCLFFTPGDDMTQDFRRTPEESLEGFDIAAIRACVANHEKRKCAFCQKPGAVSTCANNKCKKTGWYHFPCGLKNGSVQDVQFKTFCFKCADKKKIDAKERGKRKSESKESKPETPSSASSSKGKRKRLPVVTFRRVSKDKVTGEPIWVATSDSDSSQTLSQSSQEEDDVVENTENTLDGAGEVFDNCLNVRLRPIDCLDFLEPGQPQLSQNFSIYMDNAEEDEETAENFERDESIDCDVIRSTDDLHTSIHLKEEFTGEIIDAVHDSDSGDASRENAEGKISLVCI